MPVVMLCFLVTAAGHAQRTEIRLPFGAPMNPANREKRVLLRARIFPLAVFGFCNRLKSDRNGYVADLHRSCQCVNSEIDHVNRFGNLGEFRISRLSG